MHPFAKFAPDLFGANANMAGEAKGVLPGRNSYKPWPLPVVFSQALNSQCLGATMVRATDGSLTIWAGTTTKLYKYAGPTAAWTDVTRSSGGAYAVAAGDLWSFAIFGDKLLAANVNDVLQIIDVDSGTNFAAAGGSPPQASYVSIVGDQVMLAGIASNPLRIVWSGINNAEYWTAGSRSSGLQDFPDGGPVRAVSDLHAGLIFQDAAIRRIARVPDRTVFNFVKLEDRRGLIAPASLVTSGWQTFYLSEDGFYMTSADGQSVPIGRDVVDKWFQGMVDYDHIYETVGALDPIRDRIFWRAVGSDASFLVCYDIALNAWSWADVDADYIFAAATTGYTADNIDTLLTALGFTLETAPFSFDARFLSGGAPYLAMFDTAFKMNFFSGNNMAATLETAEFQPIPTGRAFVNGVRVLTDAENVMISVGRKERNQDSLSYGTARAVNSEGVSPQRASGRWFKVKATLAEDEVWSDIQGIDLDVRADGGR